MIEKQQFLSIIDATPLVSIDLIIEDSQGRILLGKRVNRPAQNYWFVPGGRIRKNEPLAAAIARISGTELGHSISLTEATLIGAYDHIYNDNYHGVEGINTHYVALGYSLSVSPEFKIISDSQHIEMRWWPRQELLSSCEVHANTKAYLSAP